MTTKLCGAWTYSMHFDRWQWHQSAFIMIFQYLNFHWSYGHQTWWVDAPTQVEHIPHTLTGGNDIIVTSSVSICRLSLVVWSSSLVVGCTNLNLTYFTHYDRWQWHHSDFITIFQTNCIEHSWKCFFSGLVSCFIWVH